MTPEIFKRVERVFAQTVGAPRDRQDRVAQEACAGDVVVLKQVRSLLDAHRADIAPGSKEVGPDGQAYGVAHEPSR